MAALHAAAERSERSLNAEIVVRLFSTFEDLPMPNTSGVAQSIAGQRLNGVYVERVQVNHRIPSALMDAIKIIAVNNNRSVTAQIEFILAAFVADQAPETGSTCPTPEASR